jgi:hypothetical protein
LSTPPFPQRTGCLPVTLLPSPLPYAVVTAAVAARNRLISSPRLPTPSFPLRFPLSAVTAAHELCGRQHPPPTHPPTPVLHLPPRRTDIHKEKKRGEEKKGRRNLLVCVYSRFSCVSFCLFVFVVFCRELDWSFRGRERKTRLNGPFRKRPLSSRAGRLSFVVVVFERGNLKKKAADLLRDAPPCSFSFFLFFLSPCF